MKNSTELLLEEYKIGKQVYNEYLKNMYSVISFTLLLYGALFVIKYENALISIAAVYLYFLPIATDILGLLFLYNIYFVTKHRLYLIMLEMKIKVNYDYKKDKKICNFIGWEFFAQKKILEEIVVYGTTVAFYIALPAFDILYGYKQKNLISSEIINLNLSKIIDLILSKIIDLILSGVKNISSLRIIDLVNIIPIIIYIIYVISSIYFIQKIFKIYSKIKKIRPRYDGTKKMEIHIPHDRKKSKLHKNINKAR